MVVGALTNNQIFQIAEDENVNAVLRALAAGRAAEITGAAREQFLNMLNGGPWSYPVGDNDGGVLL